MPGGNAWTPSPGAIAQRHRPAASLTGARNFFVLSFQQNAVKSVG